MDIFVFTLVLWLNSNGIPVELTSQAQGSYPACERLLKRASVQAELMGLSAYGKCTEDPAEFSRLVEDFGLAEW